MRWYLNEERELLQKAFREFVQERVKPYVEKMENEDAGCRDLILEMGQLGFLGFNMPEEKGGAGIDYIAQALLIEEIAKESYTVAFSTMLAPMFNAAISRGGTEEQFRKYAIPAINGEHLIALAGNEAMGSGYLDGMSTVAVREGDKWVINGTKVFISQSDIADYYMVMTRTVEHPNPMTGEGLEMFFVKADAEGVSNGHLENKLGMRGSRSGTVYFDNVRVSEKDRMNNASVFEMTDHAGLYAAMDLGAAEAALDKTINYLKQRVQYGASLWDAHEAARKDAAILYGKISNFRNAVYGHMANLNNGEKDMMEGLPLKREGAHLLEEVSRECMVLMGAAGLIHETGIEKSYRDVMMSTQACGSEKTFETMMGSLL